MVRAERLGRHRRPWRGLRGRVVGLRRSCEDVLQDPVGLLQQGSLFRGHSCSPFSVDRSVSARAARRRGSVCSACSHRRDPRRCSRVGERLEPHRRCGGSCDPRPRVAAPSSAVRVQARRRLASSASRSRVRAGRRRVRTAARCSARLSRRVVAARRRGSRRTADARAALHRRVRASRSVERVQRSRPVRRSRDQRVVIGSVVRSSSVAPCLSAMPCAWRLRSRSAPHPRRPPCRRAPA